MRVLEGEVVEVDGVRILGDADPRATRIGVGTTLVGDEDVTDLSSRLAQTACDDAEGVDLLLVHDPSAGDDALAQGCVPAQLSGHLHRRIGPAWLGHGTRYVSSSTAGAALGATTIGPLNGIAELTVLRIDPDSGRVLDYRLVQIRPDASAGARAGQPYAVADQGRRRPAGADGVASRRWRCPGPGRDGVRLCGCRVEHMPPGTASADEEREICAAPPGPHPQRAWPQGGPLSPDRRKGAPLRPGPLGVWAGGCRTDLPLLVCRCRAGRHVLDPTTGQPYAVTARPGTAPPSRGHPIGSGGPSAPLIPYCTRLSGAGTCRSPGQASASPTVAESSGR